MLANIVNLVAGLLLLLVALVFALGLPPALFFMSVNNLFGTELSHGFIPYVNFWVMAFAVTFAVNFGSGWKSSP